MKKRTSQYYLYMEPFFERGDKAEIALAKLEYRRLYKAKWKNENRKKCKEITVKFTMPEYKEIESEAKRHHQKLAPFIKASSIAYIRKTFVVPDTASVNKILQLLKTMYIQVEDFVQDKGNGDIYLQALYNLERDIRIALISPNHIETATNKNLEK